jgi:hypothetical protein
MEVSGQLRVSAPLLPPEQLPVPTVYEAGRMSRASLDLMWKNLLSYWKSNPEFLVAHLLFCHTD